MNIPRLIASNFARYGKPIGVKPCTLIKVTPGTRTPGAVSGGTHPTSTSHSATGFVSDYTAYEISGTQIVAGDRKVVLFGASIQGGAQPAPSDTIVIGGETLHVVDKGVTSDPVQATWICQCRK